MLRVVTICNSGRPLASIPAIRIGNLAGTLGCLRFPIHFPSRIY